MYDEALEAANPLPVSVEPDRSKKPKRKSDSKRRSKSKVPKVPKNEPASAGAESPGAAASDHASEVLQSFDPKYQEIIQQLPRMIWPCSSKHGAYSYTATLI